MTIMIFYVCFIEPKIVILIKLIKKLSKTSKNFYLKWVWLSKCQNNTTEWILIYLKSLRTNSSKKNVLKFNFLKNTIKQKCMQ